MRPTVPMSVPTSVPPSTALLTDHYELTMLQAALLEQINPLLRLVRQQREMQGPATTGSGTHNNTSQPAEGTRNANVQGVSRPLDR